MASRRQPESPRPKDPAAPPTTESSPTTSPARRRAPRAKTAVTVSAIPPRVEVSEDARRAMIAEAAYLRAEQRGFAAGYEVEDWLAAEVEVDALLRAEHAGTPQ